MVSTKLREEPNIVKEIIEEIYSVEERLQVKWGVHFEWLAEIVEEAKKSRETCSSGTGLLPQTPGRRKRKKVTSGDQKSDENNAQTVSASPNNVAVCTPLQDRKTVVQFQNSAKRTPDILGASPVLKTPKTLISSVNRSKLVSPLAAPIAIQNKISETTPFESTPPKVTVLPETPRSSLGKENSDPIDIGRMISTPSQETRSENTPDKKGDTTYNADAEYSISKYVAKDEPCPQDTDKKGDENEPQIESVEQNITPVATEATSSMACEPVREPVQSLSSSKATYHQLQSPGRPIFAKPVNLVTTVSSFISRNSPRKETRLAKTEKLQEELLRKEKQRERIKEEAEKRKKIEIEEKKRKREERERRVQQLQQMQQEREKEKRQLLLSRGEQAKKNEEKMRKMKEQEEEDKRKQRQQKAAMVEERRRVEEAEKQRRVAELLEEDSRKGDFLQRKAEYEQQERLKKLAEQKKQEESRLEELEKLRRLAEEEKRQEIEEREKRRADMMKEQREKQERERKQHQMEMKIAKQKLQEEIKKQVEREEERAKPIFRSPGEPASSLKSVNKSITMPSPVAPAKPPPSYKMTPERDSYVSYNIDDLSCGDSTDDDDKPAKRVPNWAKAAALRSHLLHKDYVKLDPEEIFTDCLDAPKLEQIFKRNRPRFFKRTSSACWGTPPLSKRQKYNP